MRVHQGMVRGYGSAFCIFSVSILFVIVLIANRFTQIRVNMEKNKRARGFKKPFSEV